MKRLTLICILFTTSVVADGEVSLIKECDASHYRESELGIDYLAIAPCELAWRLSLGEAEWMTNAPAKYGSKTSMFWKKSIIVKILSGRSSDSIFEKLRAFTPDMLRSFGSLKGSENPIYLRLSAEGQKLVLEGFSAAIDAKK